MSIYPLDSTIDHIRKRPGMYLGSTGVEGLRNLIFFTLQDHIDFDHNFNIKFSINENESLLIKLEEKPIRNTDNNPHIYQFSLPTIAALSKKFILNDVLVSDKGVVKIDADQIEIMRSEKLELLFEIDYSIMKDLVMPDFFHFNQLLEYFTYIYNNVSIELTDFRLKVSRKICNPNGMLDKLKQIDIDNAYLSNLKDHGNTFRTVASLKEYKVDIALDYNSWGCINFVQYSYAELDRQGEGNSLLDGILQGIKLAIMRIAKEEEIQLKPMTYGLIRKGLCIAAVVKGGELIFGGSTKFILVLDKLKKLVREHVAETFYHYLKDEKAQSILWLFERENVN